MKAFARFKMNITPIIKWALKIDGYIFTLITIVIAFIPLEEIGVEKTWAKVLLLCSIPIISFIFSSILVVFFLKRNRIWRKGKNTVTASYGDLFDYSFSAKYKESRIIVIPFNDTFDTMVETPNESVGKTLVSPKTLHGVWIKKYCTYFNITPNALNEKIQKSLTAHGFIGKKIQRERGNNIKYSLGDVSIINGPNNAIFYLLAASTFDENNNAHVKKRELRDCVDCLLDFYDRSGQSIPIYIPLIGTGSSRAGLSHEKSLDLIKSCVLTSEEKINGSINIVVYNGDKNKVSIFK